MFSQKAIISTTDTPEQYHAVKAVSNSGITKILRCPAIFRAWQDGEADEESSEALLFGSVFHCLALEPVEFTRRYAIKKENGNSKAGRDEKAKAEAAGLAQVKLEIYEKALSMAGSVNRQKLVQAMLKAPDVMREVSIYWNEDFDGMLIPCKARIDLLATVPGFGLVTCDFKSTADASPEELSRSVLKWGYHRQASWYPRALQAVGMESSAFVLMAVEKTAPHIVTPANVAAQAMAVGRAECDKALAEYVKCTKNKEWPCYTKGIYELDLPEWAYKKAV